MCERVTCNQLGKALYSYLHGLPSIWMCYE